ncbi:hypothetical protein MLD38_038175 [Melastoma candidum]|uniref:Uncharacterized protein n=1 Tax=Melastoma candidum TaxID=119954 RepID=A0ACB9KYQ7_9MYRT|nr:hypothetical protein MLD38_038175 [Melastoma candidum]
MTTAIAAAAPAVSLNSPMFSPPRLIKSVPPTSSSSSVSTDSRVQEKAMKGHEEGCGSASVMNRKRPARLCIPLATSAELELGAWKGDEKEKGVEVEVEGDGYSVYSRKGKRGKCFEDRFSAVVREDGSSKLAFFGVFDGHGGEKAAEFAALHMDAKIKEEIDRGGSDIKTAVRDAYLKTDEEFMRRNGDEEASGGTCCVSALISKGSLVVSNAGDCRAVISRGGVAEALTLDHRPSVNSERERIEDNGGYVDCCNGIWRIQGSLAVSRSIGDRHLKRWVIAEPETRILPITPQSEFLILASDGLWDRVTNQEAVDVVRPMLIGGGTLNGSSAGKKLAELSSRRGSRDDITVTIVDMGRFVS